MIDQGIESVNAGMGLEYSEMHWRRRGLPQTDQTSARKLRLPAPKEFVWQYVYSTPLAEPVTQADDDNRAALERGVVAEWQRYVEDGGMAILPRMVVVTARK